MYISMTYEYGVEHVTWAISMSKIMNTMDDEVVMHVLC